MASSWLDPFKHLTLAFLAKQAGLGLRRAERAFADLQYAGLIDVRRRCEIDGHGNYRGQAAFKFIPAALFGVFRLGNWLSRERAKARLRRARADAAARRPAQNERASAQGRLLVRTALRAASRSRTARQKPAASEARDQVVEDNRRLQLAATRHYAAHPERGRGWAYEQARLELGIADLA